MVYLLKMVIFYSYVSHNRRVIPLNLWSSPTLRLFRASATHSDLAQAPSCGLILLPCIMCHGLCADDLFSSLWIQSYLLRKWDWGIIYCNFEAQVCTFSDSGHGSTGILLLENSVVCWFCVISVSDRPGMSSIFLFPCNSSVSCLSFCSSLFCRCLLALVFLVLVCHCFVMFLWRLVCLLSIGSQKKLKMTFYNDIRTLEPNPTTKTWPTKTSKIHSEVLFP